jgi:organic hydroperoxide reductase OsmC/OhrA
MNLITITHKDGLAFDVHVRRRRVATDMAPQHGGRGQGFTPAELLAGALGACMAMQVQGYCETHGHGGGDVSVSLAFEFIGKPARIGAIAVDIDLPPGFPACEKDAVRQAAEQAVICETLRHPPEVDLDIQFRS